MGVVNFLCNIIWFVLAGVWLALGWAFFGVLWCISIVGIPVGVLCCITVVGIPAGLQSFKFAKLALMPFGSQVR